MAIRPDYSDITGRIGQAPKWYDHNGVPRYGEFAPQRVGADHQLVVFALIECSICAKRFLVGSACPVPAPDEGTLDNVFHYGVVPRHPTPTPPPGEKDSVCPGEDTQARTVRIIEAWGPAGDHGWNKRYDLC